jgi:glucosamine--fructose-6-phosphate aminotransferase (isomerizing)
LSDGTLPIGAGLEIGVAATKSFTCTLTTLYMLAIYLGTLRKFIDDETRARLVTELLSLPNLVTKTLEYAKDAQSIADDLYLYSNFLFLGRGINHPIAMEGALKLKEISYIHAEGYPAGEMKHGPISLIDEKMPVVAIAPKDHLYEKILSNISEASARGAKIIAIASDKDDLIGNKSHHVLRLPDASPDLNPLLATIQLQLLSYNIAMRLGRDVDQPRNLAKSVTVE